jgi:hypothetical protein
MESSYKRFGPSPFKEVTEREFAEPLTLNAYMAGHFKVGYCSIFFKVIG